MSCKIHTITIIAILILSVITVSIQGSNLELMSRSLMQGPCKTVAFYQDLLILGTGGGVAIYTLSDEKSDHHFLPLEGEPQDIAIHGSIAYIAAKRGGLIVLRIADPKPSRVEYQYKSRHATDCAICNRYLYMSDSNRDLYIFDLNNPLTPKFKGTKALSGQINSVQAEYDVLVVVHNRKFVIYRSNPQAELKRLKTTTTKRIIKKGILKNDILYLIYDVGDVDCWSIADPNEPQKVGELSTGNITDLCLNGSYAYALTGSNDINRIKIPGMGTYFAGERGNDSSEEEMFKVMGKMEAEYPRSEDKNSWNIKKLFTLFQSKKVIGSKIFSYGNHLVAIEEKRGLSLYSIENSSLRFTSFIPTRGFAVDLVVADDLLYLANGGDGIRIGRVLKDGKINWIGHFQTELARDIAVKDNIAYVADGQAGLKVFDVSDPTEPSLLGAHGSPYFLSAIVIGVNKAYIAGGLGGLEIYEVSDPRRPELIWRREFSEVRGLEVDQKYLYFADGDEGFRIYSIDEMPPSPVSRLNTDGWNCDCYILDDIAYLADGGRGIKTVDISDRSNPKLLGELYLKTLTRELHAIKGTLFAAGHVAGIFAIDVSTPQSPKISARAPVVDDARGVFVDQRFAYLASASGGVYVFRYNK
jgi:hypothetical protein